MAATIPANTIALFNSSVAREFIVLTVLAFALLFIQLPGLHAQQVDPETARRAEDRRKAAAEIEQRNRENAEINQKLAQIVQAGNAAYAAKNYNEAVRRYDEGIALDPTQIAFYQNKASVIRVRAVLNYNAAITSSDAAAKSSAREQARKEFVEASSSINKAYELSRSQPTATATTRLQIAKERAEIMRIFVKFDPTQAEAGTTAFQDYATVETDSDLKSMAQDDAVKLLFDAGSMERTLAECKKILAINPDEIDANLYAGLAIVSLGVESRYREGIIYLQRFITLAPDTHEMKATAKQAVSALQQQTKSNR